MTKEVSTCPQLITTEPFQLHPKPTIKADGEIVSVSKLQTPECRAMSHCSDTIRIDFNHAVKVCMSDDHVNCPQFRG
ncbi:hypothetical protein ACFL3C_04695 [Patescibacteria group bacterium]